MRNILMKQLLHIILGIGFLSILFGGLFGGTSYASDNFVVSKNWLAGVPPSGEMAFDLKRKGKRKPVGFQHFKFTPNEDGSLNVDTYIQIDIYFGPFRVYKYRHFNSEVWRDGKLIKLSSQTNRNGKKQFVEIYKQDGKLIENASRRSGELPPDIISTTYFNPLFVRQKQIVNTQDGRVFPMEVTYVGRETVPTYQGDVEAERFHTQGKLAIDIWYTTQGRWVRTEFAVGKNIVVEMVPVDPATRQPPARK